MRIHTTVRALGAAAIALVVSAETARAQDVTGRVAMEGVVSARVSSADKGDPFLVFDAVSTFGVGRGWDVVIRPWAKRTPGGEWGAEMYQLQLRYSSTTGVPFRIDTGIISSPIGLATLDLRADRNPTMSAPFTTTLRSPRSTSISIA